MMSQIEMRWRPLGNCGAKVSVFSLGGWTTFGGSVNSDQDVRTILTAAFEAGINFFDIADVYALGESERVMGRVLRDFPRHRILISSKVFHPMSDDVNDRGLSRKHIMESVEKSLKRIGTDYLDMYFCHRFDPETPIEETARAMDDLIHQGKILYWGTSEWTGQQLREVNKFCDARNLYRPQIEQPQYSLVARDRFENDTAPAAEQSGMGLVVWSPLGSGLLTGKYDAGFPKDSRLGRIDWLREKTATEENLRRVREFGSYAAKIGVSRTQLALAWAASHPAVSSVILGATSLKQLAENLGALKIEMTPERRAEISAIFA